jgi:hypothetical protein
LPSARQHCGGRFAAALPSKLFFARRKMTNTVRSRASHLILD